MRRARVWSHVQGLKAKVFWLCSLLILTSIFGSPSSVRAQNVVTPTWTFQDFSQNPYGAKTVIIYPLRKVSQNTNAGVNLIVIGDPRRGTTTNSSFTTNLLNGSYYRVEFWSGYDLYAITNFFETNVVGAVDGGDPIYRAFSTNLDRGVYADSAAASMALFMLKHYSTATGYVATATDTNGGWDWEPSQGGSGGGVTLLQATNAAQTVANTTSNLLQAKMNSTSNILATASAALGANLTNDVNSTSNTLAALSQTIANTSSNSVLGNAQTAVNASSNSVIATEQTAINTSSNSVYGNAQTSINTTSNSLQSQITSGGVSITQLNVTSNSLAGTSQTIANTTSNSVLANAQTAINTASNSVVGTDQASVNTTSNLLVGTSQTIANTSSNLVLAKAQIAINTASNTINAANLFGTVPQTTLPSTVTTNNGTLLGSSLLKGDGARGVTGATAGVDFVITNQLLQLNAPQTNQYAYFDGSTGTTNVGSTVDGRWWTNLDTHFTNYGATTNIVLPADGNNWRVLATNGPHIFFSFGGNNMGAMSIWITTNGDAAWPPQVTFVGYSNHLTTNCIIDLQPWDGTNRVLGGESEL